MECAWSSRRFLDENSLSLQHINEDKFYITNGTGPQTMMATGSNTGGMGAYAPEFLTCLSGLTQRLALLSSFLKVWLRRASYLGVLYTLVFILTADVSSHGDLTQIILLVALTLHKYHHLEGRSQPSPGRTRGDTRRGCGLKRLPTRLRKCPNFQ